MSDAAGLSTDNGIRLRRARTDRMGRPTKPLKADCVDASEYPSLFMFWTTFHTIPYFICHKRNTIDYEHDSATIRTIFCHILRIKNITYWQRYVLYQQTAD